MRQVNSSYPSNASSNPPDTAHELSNGNCEARMGSLENILLIGGDSSDAEAFRMALSDSRTASITTVVRYRTEPIENEKIICVDDYFEIAPNLLQHNAYIVIFVGSSSGRLEDLLYINAIGPAKLALSAREAGCRGLLYISSLSVFGDAEYINRETPLSPRTAYGKSKLTGEQMLQSIATDAFPVSILRIPTIYDAKNRTKLHRISDLVKRIGFFILPDKTVARSMLHSRNLASALSSLISQPRSEIYFAADPIQFTFASLTDSIEKYCGKNIRLWTLPRVFFLPIKLFTPSIYSSLYQKCLIADDVVVPIAVPVDPEECMKALVSNR